MTTAVSAAVQNLVLAEQAVRYVKEKLPIGSANKLGDVVSSFGESFTCTGGLKVAFMLVLKDKSHEEKIKIIAETAERRRCGNCGEQSCVAFMFLDKKGARPLELVWFTNINHGFVVIGRDQSSPANNAGKWGPDAIVADPWLDEGKWYPAADLAKHWPGGIPEVVFGYK